MARNEYMEGLSELTYFPDEYVGIADNFFRAYKMESWTACPGEKMRIIKKGRVLVCRFCGKASEEVKFGNEAHVLSELLGNRYLVSDFECDGCNKLFGGNEDQLSKFLGMSRTVLFAKGKEKVPTFKSVGIRMETSVDDEGQSWLRISRESTNGNISYDPATGTTKVRGMKQPYVPQAVYKALVKMALSCLGEQAVEEYKFGLDYVRGDGLEEAGGIYARTVIRYTFPYAFKYERPTVLIFKKRDPDARLFNRLFLLFALNSIYILPIPFDLEDLKYGGEDLELLPPPPIFTNKYHFPTSTILREIMDLSCLEVVKDDSDAIYISGPPGERPFGYVYDNGTGGISSKEFDINDIERISVKQVLL